MAGAQGGGALGGGRGGRGNPFPFCSRFPYSPRWRWAMPQYAGDLSWTMVRGWGMTPGIWQRPSRPTAFRGFLPARASAGAR